MNFIQEYNSISSQDSPVDSFIYPQESGISPTANDYQNGSITRYFVKKVNDSIILEVTSQTYQSTSPVLYYKVNLQWQISGNINDTILNSTLQQQGVINFNKDQIKLANITMSGLTEKLSNILQFYKS